MKFFGFMKIVTLSVIISLVFASCGFNPQSPSATSTIAPPIAGTSTSISQSLVPQNTETPRIENTPTNIVANAIPLSPINTENIQQIQPLFNHQVPWDAISYWLVVISPNSKWVALAAKYSSQLYLLPLTWNTNNSIVPTIDVASSRVYKLRTESIAFSPDSAYLAVAGNNNSVAVLDLENPDKIETFDVGNWTSAVSFVGDSKTLAIGTMRGYEGSLRIIDLETGSIKYEISKNLTSGGICNVTVSPDEKILAIGYCTNVFDISTWDIDKNFEYIARLTGIDEVNTTCPHFCTDNRNIIAFNPITGDIASGTNYGRIPLQDIHSGKLRTIISTVVRDGDIAYDASPINALAFTPDGELLVIGTTPEIQIRSVIDSKLLWSHNEAPRYIAGMAMSADARLIISVNSDGEVKFWGVSK